MRWMMLKYAALDWSMPNFVALCYAQSTVVAMAVGVARVMALCCCCYSIAAGMAAVAVETAEECFLFASTAS